jgi:hypothetical protein
MIEQFFHHFMKKNEEKSGKNKGGVRGHYFSISSTTISTLVVGIFEKSEGKKNPPNHWLKRASPNDAVGRRSWGGGGLFKILYYYFLGLSWPWLVRFLSYPYSNILFANVKCFWEENCGRGFSKSSTTTFTIVVGNFERLVVALHSRCSRGEGWELS